MVMIDGPAGCGKASVGSRLAGSGTHLDDPATAAVADIEPAAALRGVRPRLVAEWRNAPTVLHHAQNACVNSRGRGLFIFTSSVSEPAAAGGGTSRRIRMRPMTVHESGDSTGDVSLAGLFAGDSVAVPRSDVSVHDVAALVCRGGFPRHLELSPDAAAFRCRNYLHNGADAAASYGGHDPDMVRRLLRAVAERTALTASPGLLAAAAAPMHRHTARSCLRTLRRLSLIEDQPACVPRLRTAAASRVSPRRHLADPSLAAAALGAGPAALAADPALLGRLFVSLVVRDLRVLAQPLGGSVSYFADGAGRLADAVVETADGALLLARAVLGGAAVETAARDLRRVAAALHPATPPPRLVVICAVGAGRWVGHGPDLVAVVPVCALGP